MIPYWWIWGSQRVKEKEVYQIEVSKRGMELK